MKNIKKLIEIINHKNDLKTLKLISDSIISLSKESGIEVEKYSFSLSNNSKDFPLTIIKYLQDGEMVFSNFDNTKEVKVICDVVGMFTLTGTIYNMDEY